MPSRQVQGGAEWRRRLVPAASVVAASLATTLPFPLAWSVMPNIAMLLVLIWASVQPRLMPVWAAFLLGLLHDALVGGPLGAFGLVFALLVVAVRMGEGRLEARWLSIDWLLAGILVMAAHILLFLVLPLAGSTAPLPPLLVQGGLTALCFPPALALAALLHRRLVEQD